MEREPSGLYYQKAEETELMRSAKIYIDEYLPLNEPRIQEKINPSCQVVVVIPAYGERNYILRPLSSLAWQAAVTPEEYEVIIVINNPPSPPQRLNDQNEIVNQARFHHYEEAVTDNQSTIHLLQHIKSSSPYELNSQESQLVDTIRQSGLIFHIIDKASEGKTLPPDQANVGGARNRGVAEAVARFVDINRNGIIAQSDADIRFEPDFIANLIEQYKNHPEIIGFRGSVELEAEVDAKTVPEVVTETTKIKRLYKKLLNRYKDIYGVPYRGKVDQNQDENESAPVFWGSNMSSRAFQTAQVGGVPILGAGEDPAFGQRLSAIGKIGFAENVKVSQLSRVSARAEGGHGIGILKANNKLSRGLSVEVENPLIISHVGSLIKAIREKLSDHQKQPQGMVIAEMVRGFLISKGIFFREKRLTYLSNYIDSNSLITDEGLYDFLRKLTKIPLEQAVSNLLITLKAQTNLENSSEYRELATACHQTSTKKT